MADYKQIIILRKDLNMRKGKMVAQGAHASMAVILNLKKEDATSYIIPKDPRIEPWINGRFKKITVSVNSEDELLALHEEAKKRGFLTSLILDSGLTEFKEPTYTAVAIGPDNAIELDKLTGNLPLL